MKKISIGIFTFSVVFYLLFYFVLCDAPTTIAVPSFLACLILSIVNIVMAIVSLAKNSVERPIPTWLAVIMFLVNVPIFLFFAFYILVVFFVPFNLKVG